MIIAVRRLRKFGSQSSSEAVNLYTKWLSIVSLNNQITLWILDFRPSLFLKI
jgi:hypothetical protein